ncbi:MAG: hypothetical protein ACOVQ4_14345 [Flectobacillus sp.]|uniref:hypothetical protein n=1 Tax=Flectobacillus sp. TaxID=50419 RepID=UPI003B9CAAB0
MKKSFFLSISLLLALGSVKAQTSTQETPKDRKRGRVEARLANLTPEQKAQLEAKVEARKAKLDSLSPEEKAALKGKRKELIEKWKSLSPEERKALKEQWRTKKAGS